MDLKNQLPKIIESLSPDSKPAWGKMTPQQMIEHLSLLYVVSSGKLKTDQKFNNEKTATYKNKFFSTTKPFQPNMKIKGIDQRALPTRYSSFEEAKKVLLKSINEFYQHFQEDPSTTVRHPVIGLLTFDEWEHFHNKHVKHHLEQFKLWNASENDK